MFQCTSPVEVQEVLCIVHEVLDKNCLVSELSCYWYL